MLNLTTLNHFLLVAWSYLQYILLQSTVWPHYTYYILYPEQNTFTNYYALFLYTICSFTLVRSAA